MSLINQMLKDLDARRETDSRSRLHREVRPLPAAPARFSPRAGGLLALAVAALGAGAWYFARSPVELSLSPPLAVSGAVTQPPSAEKPALAVSPPPLPVAESVAPLAGTDSTPGLPVLEPVGGMKMSMALDKPPTVPSMAPAVAPRAIKPPAERGDPPSTTTAARPVKPESASSAASGSIERQSSAAEGGRDASGSDYRRAAGMASSGRVDDAVDSLLDILRRDGGHVASRQLLARLLIEQRRIDEAHAILAEGLALKPSQTGWAMMLARLQVEQGDLAAAARTLQASQPHALENADYLGFAGHVQYRLGQQRPAADLYLRAARVAPGDGRWWFGLGLALESEQKWGEAREAFLRARATGALPPELQVIVEQKLR